MFTATQKIKELRGQGWDIKVQMRRATIQAPKGKFDSSVGLSAKGGTTTVELTAPGGEQFTGMAICHPEKDNFNKKIGLEIALGRALKKANGE